MFKAAGFSDLKQWIRMNDKGAMFSLKRMDYEHEERENSEERYQFMREQIRPQRKQHVVSYIRKMLGVSILALIFGGFCGVGFLAVQEIYQGDAKSEAAMLESTISPASFVAAAQTGTDEKTGNEKNEATVDEQAMERYQNFLEETAMIGKQCNEYIVSVSGTGNGSWFEEKEDELQSGIIIRETKGYYYILTFLKGISHSSKMTIRFLDGSIANAQVQGVDSGLGIAVLKVQKNQVSETTRKTIRVASFGMESNLKLNTPIIAVGKPNDVMYSVMMGNIVNDELSASITDGEIDLYSCNISSCQNGDGFVTDIRGNIVGIISSAYPEVTGESNAAFIGISKIHTLIERLIYKSDVAYLGIKGCDLDNQVCKDMGEKSGIYVTEVVAESPAYKGKVRVADVLTQIDGENIGSLQALRVCLLQHEPGDEITLCVKRSSGKKYIDKEIKVVLE